MSTNETSIDDAKPYYDKAKNCADDPSSPDCESMADEQAENVLVEYGLDPQLAKDAVACARTRDREKCAKTSAKIAAVYACSASTAGAGTAICSKLAPAMVDKVWPVMGPPLVKAWDIAFDTLDGVISLLKGVANAFGDILGFGDDGPSRTEILNDLRWKAHAVCKSAIASGSEAVSAANIESRKELGLPLPLQSGGAMDAVASEMLGAPPIAPGGMVVMPVDAQSSEAFKQALRPKFKQVNVVWKAVNRGAYEPPNYRFVGDSYTPTKDEVLVRSAGCPDKWSPGDSSWAPENFTTETKLYNHQWKLSELRNAVGMIVAERADSVSTASVEASGRVIAQNISQGQQNSESGSSSNWWIWVTAVAGAAYAGYRYRKPIMKRLKI